MFVLSHTNRYDVRAYKFAFHLRLAFIGQHLKHFAEVGA